jgi:DNA/RNA endonuclease YhcR with UshA esterase domain
MKKLLLKNIYLTTLYFFISNFTYSQLSGNATHIPNSSLNINSNEWSYITITKGSNNQGQIYKNGNLVYSGSWLNLTYNWSRIDLGAVFYTSYNSWFNGQIDELRISNTVRTSTEILNHYTGNIPFTTDSNTIGLWHFDDSNPAVVSSVTGQNGVGTNTSISTGKFGNSVSFNGTTSRVSINQSVPNQNITIEFWIKPTANSNSWPVNLYGYNTSGFAVNTVCSSATPTGAIQQTFCESATIANLVATGTAIKWYATASGNTLLPASEPLVDESTYYATQTVNGCESISRMAVTVGINNPEIQASATTICNGSSISLEAISGAAVTTNFPIGSVGPSGGYVFYDQGSVINGWRYLEVAPSDISTGAVWGCSGTSISGISTSIGSGQLNTNLVITNCTTSGIAAKLCDQVTINGYSDWYLPSKDEFNQIYQNIFLRGLGDFAPNSNSYNRYWTSSQAAPENGWAQDFTPYYQQVNGKSELSRVRPIRQFISSLPFSTYRWSTGATTAIINPTPTQTTTYWVDVTTNGVTCRKSITINVINTLAPTGSTSQSYCSTSTIANLTATGTAVKWYTAAIGGTALSAGTALTTGTYYASQTVNGCESQTRLAVAATVNTILAPIGASQQTLCKGSTIANLNVIGTAIKWYLPSTVVSTALDNTTVLVNGTTYYASQTINGCESISRLAVFVSLNDPQIQASSLVICKGSEVSLSVSDINNTHQINNKVAEFKNDSKQSIGITYSSQAPRSNFSYDFWFNTNRTINLLSEKTGGVSVQAIYGQNFIVFPVQPRGSGVSVGTNGLSIIEHSPNFFDSRFTYQRNLIGWHHCAVVYTNNNFSVYLDGVLIGTRNNGSNFGGFGTTYSNVGLTQSIGEGYPNYDANDHYTGKLDEYRQWNVGLTSAQVNQIYKRKLQSVNMAECSLNLTFDQGLINNNITNSNSGLVLSNTVSPNYLSDNTFLIGELTGTSINSAIDTNLQETSSSSYVWSTGATTSTIEQSPTQTTDYWVDVTTNGTTCRKSITIIVNNPPAPTGVARQAFCGSKSISNLAVSGSAVKWYTVPTGGTILAASTSLTTGTYYASQTVNGCESQARLAVEVSVNPTLPPSGVTNQTLCEGSTVLDLSASGSSIKWYATAVGGTAIAPTTSIINGTIYYASQTVNGCESVSRLAVAVSTNNPQIEANATTICAGSPLSLTAFDRNNLQQSNNNIIPSHLQNGLIGFWPFNGNTNDISGNGNNGISNGAQLTTDRLGKQNSAYSFTTGQDITIPNTSSTNIYPMTVSLWYNVATLATSGENSNLFSKYVPGAWNGFQIVVSDSRNVNSGNLQYNDGYSVNSWYIKDTNNRVLGYYGETPFLQPNIQPNTWYHYVFTLDSSGGKIYVNNQLVDSHPWTGNPGSSLNDFLWKIGGLYDTWFKGKIDDVGVWNRALNQNEVQSLYVLNTNSTSYLWSTGATTATINPTPAQTTDYWVDVTTNGVTCRKSININVTNIPAPTGAATQNFCGPKTIANLVATGTAVKWYATERGGNALTSTTTITTGTYYASQTVNGCESQTRLAVNAVINSFPEAILITSGGTIIKLNDVLTLSTVSSISGQTYKWFKNNAVIATTLTNSLKVSISGNYKVEVTNKNGCSVISNSINVIVIPQTNFTVATTEETCLNQKNGSITVTAKLPLAYVATLSKNGEIIKSNNFDNQTSFTNLIGGDYTLCISISGDQEPYKQCYEVRINKPQDLSVFSEINESNFISLTLSGGDNYNIDLNGKKYTTKSNQIVLPTQLGTNNLTVTTDLNCQGVYLETFSVTDEILTYPNPFTDEFTIQIPNSIMLDSKSSISINVFNLNGALVYHTEANKNEGYLKLNLGNIAMGTYLLHVQNHIFKIVKK